MKKPLFIASISLLSAGWAIELSPGAVIAKTPMVAQQQPTSDISLPSRNSEPSQVQLVNPGVEPRQQMRLKPSLNVKQTAMMTVKLAVKMSADGQSLPEVVIPSSVLTIQAEATKIDPNGDIHYQFSYINADLLSNTGNSTESAIETMRSAVKKLVGLKGSFVIDSRGLMKGGEFIVPADADNRLKQIIQQMSQSLEQFFAPLPAEAVGKGAKWRRSFPLNYNGISVNNIATYELISFREGVAVLNVALEQQAKPQNINSPQFPADATLQLKSLAAQGRGESTMQLDKLMPIRSALSMNSNTEISIKVVGRPQESTVKSEFAMEMTLDSK
ncbi:DUF6263 family protein [Tychonema sp. BBK16]|uniref:DUF6263 family protein n=1 Tax=Tychonema sp. BBK16 TaxID=2699888 RepID=UPI001F1FFBA4|nr:DUF6263 family protein [Tychonema sp. BBK16]MCF6373358.1 DUF6263 family protein [Tychonema sp. BBK16]